jgi:SAM-dependent methyltransferase
MMTVNTDPSAYDPLYERDYWGRNAPETIPYRRLFERVRDTVNAQPVSTVLEVGCGSGVLGAMLIEAGLAYRGFDFHPLAVLQASERNGHDRHYVGDATDAASYRNLDYDGIVCCEVLEHIPDDLAAIELWQPGTICVCSVPNFPFATHVRHFKREREVIDRYGNLIDITRIERIAKRPGVGLPWRDWLRRVRWSAQENPRKALAMLGVNTFAWGGGWFLFWGRRLDQR